MRDGGVKLLCENAPNLTQLDLCGCTQITDDALVFVGALFNLAKLVLLGWTKITDPGLSNLASLDDLRVLVLNDCLHITTEGIVTHLGALKSLRQLYVEQCPQVSESIVQRLPGMEISQLNDGRERERERSLLFSLRFYQLLRSAIVIVNRCT